MFHTRPYPNPKQPGLDRKENKLKQTQFDLPENVTKKKPYLLRKCFKRFNGNWEKFFVRFGRESNLISFDFYIFIVEVNISYYITNVFKGFIILIWAGRKFEYDISNLV